MEDRFKSQFKKRADGEADGFRFGESGYVEIMSDIKDMVEAGYAVVDILLKIGELYDREKATEVLEEARRQGIL